mmetsp:Transcript_57657/g.113542  ORF Transcript_57657/g.113542 Transcript_57657/m.113542 type:complete len:286 (+) Transcript_57657:28-885(+)
MMLVTVLALLVGQCAAFAPTSSVVAPFALPRSAIFTNTRQVARAHPTSLTEGEARPPLRFSATKVALAAASLGALYGFSVAPAYAAAAATSAGEKLHLGQKVAQAFRGKGLVDEAIVFVIAAMPVLELRGAVPVGLWMDMPVLKVFLLSVAGNMLPIAPLLFALRFDPVQKFLKPVLDRARAKTSSLGDDGSKSRAFLLAAFVGVPLPGTGAWTGAMGSFLVGMQPKESLVAIFAGVVCSGLIMTAITIAGLKGALVAGTLLLGPLLGGFVKGLVKGKGDGKGNK